MDSEFNEFFQDLEKLSSLEDREIENILKPLKFYLLMAKVKKYLKILLIVVSICLAIYYVDILNWYFCAIGRILMIKILPFWNWRYLANAKCLIEKSFPDKKEYENNNHDDFNIKDCRACKFFGE